ncbi:hypothetical protein, partial [Pseudomonas sp. 2995-3]|uniref:hypothetical protein n=1 Tax=Pseudomonas sp. 2995-3 TaxID=1712680 RepID=UPI000C6625E6
FEEHTEISSELVRRIKNGFQTIEYEMDDLLVKLNGGWSVNDQLPFIPEDYVFPKDMQIHLDANIPLLDRQIKRLKQRELSFTSQGGRDSESSEDNGFSDNSGDM